MRKNKAKKGTRLRSLKNTSPKVSENESILHPAYKDFSEIVKKFQLPIRLK